MRKDCYGQLLGKHLQKLRTYAKENNINFTFEHDEDNVVAWIDRINFDKVITPPIECLNIHMKEAKLRWS